MIKHIFQRSGDFPITVRTTDDEFDIPLHQIKYFEPTNSNTPTYKSITTTAGKVYRINE